MLHNSYTFDRQPSMFTKIPVEMDMELLDHIKKITIIALVSDDILMENLVLKGGNAINFIHKLSSRSSIDLDYSIAGDFSKEELKDIESRIRSVLEKTFEENGYRIFDVKFKEQPEKVNEKVRHFWGGYVVEFKVIEAKKYDQFEKIDDVRRNALVLGKNNSTKYTIDISKYEFVEAKTDYEIDGYSLFAYSPEMIICEKIRALCQQVPKYKEVVLSMTPKSRARDFFDIYTLIAHFKVDLTQKENIELLKNVLSAKFVPIEYLSEVKNCKELHQESYAALKDTLKANEELHDFDFYFNYIIELLEEIVSNIES